jgi:hypothetical protein
MKYLRTTQPAVLVFVAMVALGFTFTGCDDDPAVLAQFEPEISNVADSFSLQATGVTDVTAVIDYTWSNSGTRATINHSTTTDAGSATLVIKDSSGVSVYSEALVPSLNETTLTGAAGLWTIEVTLTNYSGTINFSAQKL